MAEKSKKKAFFKRWNSQIGDDAPKSPTTPTANSPVQLRTNNSNDIKPKRGSITGIKELVQCPLCLDVLLNPKILPCQHTFCYACLIKYIADFSTIKCPTCETTITITDTNYIDKLPSNLYIDMLLQVMGVKISENNVSPTMTIAPQSEISAASSAQSVELFAAGVRCTNCKSICDNVDVKTCQHCSSNLCKVCWAQHLDDMRVQVASILKQLDSASKRLDHKIENFKDRIEQITEQINITTKDNIEAILEKQQSLLSETTDIQKMSEMSALALKSTLEEAKKVAHREMSTENLSQDDNAKVMTFVNLHQNTIQILTDVSKWGAEHLVFDKEGFCIEKDSSYPVDTESDDPVLEGIEDNNPLENEDTLSNHYKSCNFKPHYVWRKATRPAGVAIGPWNGHLYICAIDIHSVLVVERSLGKIVLRLKHEDLLYPVHVTFLKTLGEIYVTDKWKHCVHVFSKDGVYLRAIGQKGSRVGMFRSPEGIAADNSQQLLYVVDTGNDRVQILHPDGKFEDMLGVVYKEQSSETNGKQTVHLVPCTELNAPTSVAVSNDRVVILDGGNRRVKIYDKLRRSKILEFGSTGQRRGQFRQPETLAVDPLGFILVGDSGNCRVQIFNPNGQLIRVFGGYGTDPGKFGWISGIHVTKQLDVIVTDAKNHNVVFF